jgi:hypothetical protein
LRDERSGATGDPGMPRHPPRNQLDATLSPRTVQVPAGLAGGLAALLGTLGYVVAGFGVISNCTDQFDCGSDTCAPCAAAGSWINAGAIGQWALVMAVVVLVILALRQPGRRLGMAISLWAVIPVSCGWIALSTSVAQRSF